MRMVHSEIRRPDQGVRSTRCAGAGRPGLEISRCAGLGGLARWAGRRVPARGDSLSGRAGECLIGGCRCAATPSVQHKYVA